MDPIAKHLYWHTVSRGHQYIRAWRRDRLPGEGWQAHRHDYVELVLIDEGRLQHQVGASVSELRPGDLIAIVPNEEHSGLVLGPEPLAFTNISCDLASYQRLALAYDEDGLCWPHIGPVEQRCWVLAAGQRQLLRDVLRLIDGDTQAGRDLLLLTIARLLGQAGQAAAADRLPLWLRRGMRDLVDAGPERMNVSDLARQCRCSREHINRTCRRLLGQTATAVLVDYRLGLAAQELAHNDQGIEVIASRFGFRSPGYFFECFKKRYGCTPHAYRKRFETAFYH